MLLIERKNYILKINKLLKTNPVVALIGPRQVGKTTLARQIAKNYSSVTFFDLENPTNLARLQDPFLALQSLQGLIVIDEIQLQPDLFKILRVLVDEPSQKRKFLVLGSASATLLKQTSESLAGRIAYLEINGFSLPEVGMQHLEKLWLRGTFPRSYLAKTQDVSQQWRQDFIRTFLERDLPQLGINIPAITMRRFWMMLAHYHGQIWNASEFARAFGMNDKTVKHYLDILTSTFLIKQISPWWENISKRQVKAPKIYFNDSGLLHSLLSLNSKEELESHPKVGASWEGFAMNAIINHLKPLPEELFYWRTYSGAKIDLFIMQGNKRLGFEFKRTSSPSLTPSLLTACQDLALTNAYVVYAGDEVFQLNEKVTAFGLSKMLEVIKP